MEKSMCLGSVIETLNSLAELRLYNYLLLSLILTLVYIVKTLPFYFYNPRAFFGFNKKCVLWLVGPVSYTHLTLPTTPYV